MCGWEEEDEKMGRVLGEEREDGERRGRRRGRVWEEQRRWKAGLNINKYM
jgi:hypothetical protein